MEEKRGNRSFFTILGLLFLVWFIGMLLPMVPISSAASNQTVLTKLNVTNTEPHVYNVTISPNPIVLTPGTTTNVTCNATVTDYNGVPLDIASVNATLYLSGASATIKNDTRYFSSCYNVTEFSSTSALYRCDFNVHYFARNGTWLCNVTAYDVGVLNGSNTSTALIDPLIALNVSDVIDYGNVPVFNTSDEREANITNFGNVPINISVRGWGGQNESLYGNLSMVCELGNISIDYERYSNVSGQVWTNMINLTDTNRLVNGLIVSMRNDTFAPINKTYWRIKVPGGVGGLCNGTILFTASNNN